MAQEKEVEAKKAEAVEEKVEQPVQETESQEENQNSYYFAIGGLVLSILNLCGWFLPIVGCPMGIIALVLGILGLKSEKGKTFAIIAIVISAITILLAVLNGAAGAFLNISDTLQP